MRLTHDMNVTAAQIRETLEKEGLRVVATVTGSSRIVGTADGVLRLAKGLTTPPPDKRERVYVDHPSVSPDEAVELFVHHCQLAAMYFEATPEDGARQINEEAQRRVRLGAAQHVADATSAMAAALNTYYEGLKQGDEEDE